MFCERVMWTTVKNVIMLAMMAASAVSEELTPQEKCEAEDELMCKKINTITEEVAYMTVTQVRDSVVGGADQTAFCDPGCSCTSFAVQNVRFESCAPPATPPPTPAPPTPVPCVNPIDPETSKHVIGYFPNWSQYRTPDNPESNAPDNHYVLKADGVNYCQLTHAVFSFATVQFEDFEFGNNPDYPDAQLKEYRQENTHWENPDATKILAGEVVPMEWNDYVNWKLMKDTIAAQGAHTKMLLSIGGWTAGTNTFHEMAKDSTKMQRFINSLFAISEKYGFVGVDLDWEYPGWITTGSGNFSSYNNEKAKDGERNRDDARAAEDIVHFCTLITKLKTQAQAKFSFHYTISAAVKANPHESLYNRTCMAENLDWVGIMAYDYHGVWDANSGSGMVGGHSALTDARLQDGQSTANAWTYWNEIVPSDKLVVGLATYGKGFKVQEVTPATDNNLFIRDPAGKQYQSVAGTAYKGPYVSEAGTNPYYEIIGHWPDRSQWHYDEDNFIWAVNGPDFIGFDDECTIINKTHWALQTQDAAGVMVWELSFDDVYNKYPLMSVIHDAAVDLDREVTCQRSQGNAIANTKFTAIVPPTAAPSTTAAPTTSTTAAPTTSTTSTTAAPTTSTTAAPTTSTTAAPTTSTTAAPTTSTTSTTAAPTTSTTAAPTTSTTAAPTTSTTAAPTTSTTSTTSTTTTTTTPPPTPKPTQSDNLSPGAVAAIAIASACVLAYLLRF